MPSGQQQCLLWPWRMLTSGHMLWALGSFYIAPRAHSGQGGWPNGWEPNQVELSVLWVCAAFCLQVDCRISLGFWANALWSLSQATFMKHWSWDKCTTGRKGSDTSFVLPRKAECVFVVAHRETDFKGMDGGHSCSPSPCPNCRLLLGCTAGGQEVKACVAIEGAQWH